MHTDTNRHMHVGFMLVLRTVLLEVAARSCAFLHVRSTRANVSS